MNGAGEWLRLIVTNGITLVVAMLVLYGDLDSGKTSTIDVAYQRVNNLELQNDQLRDDVAAMAAENMRLQSEMLSSTTYIKSIGVYLDSLPNPAWIKEVVFEADGTVTFRMAAMNRAYEDAFGVSRHLYIGQTDYEIWSAEVADGFFRNDLQVWTTKAPVRYREQFAMRGRDVSRWVIKYLVSLQAGGRWGIAGVIFDYGSPYEDCPGHERDETVGGIDYSMHVSRRLFS